MSEETTLNFDTCKHRSSKELKFGKKFCCGSNVREAFYCYKLKIEGVSPDICQNCEHYESREEP